MAYDYPLRWAKRGAIVGFALSLIPVALLAWTWWVPPVTGDDIMATGYGYSILALPAALILPGDLTSRGIAPALFALAIISAQWAAAGALVGWLIQKAIAPSQPSSPDAI